MTAIPYRDLIVQPEKYQPLSSVKSVMNVENEPDFTDIHLESVFKSRPNMLMLARNLYKIHRQNGGRSSIEKFRAMTPRLAHAFSKRTNIDEYMTAEACATGFNNWVEALKAINNDFIKYCYNWIKWNHFVPTREWAEVGATGERKQVRFNQLQPDDNTTLDLWRTQEIQRMNKHFRYGNKIPVWQRTMHNRYYDRANEGLKENDPDRASLETPIYGYNMTNIHAMIDKWHNEEWFGI